jgi:Double zinc ribbon
MSRQCSSCGAVVRDDNSVFCDRCGTRLPAAGPAAVLTCRKCGKTQSDRLSRFCDRCGSPLEAAEQDVPPAAPKGKRVACPACGFVNTGELLFFCRKCGSTLVKTGPVPGTGSGMQRGPVQEGMAGWRDEVVIGIPPRGTGAAPYRPVSTPEQQGPAGVPAAVQELPRKRRQEKQKKRGPIPKKKLAAVAAGVILLLLAVAFLTGNIPGMQNNSTANASVSNSTAPGLFEPIMKVFAPGQAVVTNNTTSEVTDKPLTVKKTPTPIKTITPVKTTTLTKTPTPTKTTTTAKK